MQPEILAPIACVLAYLAGSIPFGYLIARLKGIDIRKHGSGNIGATNVGRVLGKKFGAICFLLDFAKGLAPSLVFGLWLTRERAASFPPIPGNITTGDVLWWIGVAACAIVGHMFPVWLKFKGGKGVATSFGALCGVFPVLTIAALGSLVVWLISARLTRMVGISSCIAASVMPLFVLFSPILARTAGIALHNTASSDAQSVAWPYVSITVLLAALVIYKHRANIARTIAGTEPRFGQRAPASTDARRSES